MRGDYAACLSPRSSALSTFVVVAATIPMWQAASAYRSNSTRSCCRGYAAAANVSEGEIVERALRVADLRALIAQIRNRSDLDAEASTPLVREELRAARADARNRAA